MAEKAPLITAERLRQVLDYNPEAGVFAWLLGKRAGQVAGGLNEKGYRLIGIDGRNYRAHRLAWLYVTGSWPALDIDHKNCARDDNRFANLREATPRQNSLNARAHKDSKSGLKGVCLQGSRWKAHIRHAGQQRHLGYFSTAAEAHAAYCSAAVTIDPEFARFA
jgi:hypothetical protein